MVSPDRASIPSYDLASRRMNVSSEHSVSLIIISLTTYTLDTDAPRPHQCDTDKGIRVHLRMADL